MKKTLHLLLPILGLVGIGLLGCSQPKTTAEAPSTFAVIETAKEPATVETEESVPQGHFVTTPATQEKASLKVKFVLDGKAPKPTEVDGNNKDPICTQLEILKEELIVGKGGEIKYIAMYLDTRSTDIDLPEFPVPEEKPVLDNKGCVFVPHVFKLRAGQVLTVKNSDAAGHNANFQFFNNDGVNMLVPANNKKDMDKAKVAEPAPIPIECNIHPHMRSYIIVTDHPYVGISDEKGVLEIKDLPVGEVTFKIWHEHSVKSLDKGELNGEEEKWRRGQIEVELTPGENDLGTIKFKRELFKD
ncbi:MAG: methylamine utilization protein [Planctomycetota bacterium]